jgi:hypothetical protein
VLWLQLCTTTPGLRWWFSSSISYICYLCQKASCILCSAPVNERFHSGRCGCLVCDLSHLWLRGKHFWKAKCSHPHSGCRLGTRHWADVSKPSFLPSCPFLRVTKLQETLDFTEEGTIDCPRYANWGL